MRMTKREKVLLALLLFALLFYASYRFIVTGQTETIQQVESEIQVLRGQIDRLASLPEEEQELDVKLESLRSEQNELKQNYFSLIEEQEEIILLLTEFLSSPNVVANSITFNPPRSEELEDGSVTAMDITLSYQSDYPSLLNLLRTIWQFDRKIVINQLNMSADGENVLSGNFQVHLYDLAHLTGELDSLFMWFEGVDPGKNDPFTSPAADLGFQMRYVFRDSELALLAQQPYIPFTDIVGHWAEEAIHSLGEQGAFPPTGNLNYRPDEPITRGEFVILLDRIYDWPAPDQPVDLTQFDDYESLGLYENSISRAVFSGYLSGFVVGYQDNTLRPFDPITYEEVEFIMRKVLENDSFNWSAQAQLIQQEAGYESSGLTDIKASLTRGEAAYFLNSLN